MKQKDEIVIQASREALNELIESGTIERYSLDSIKNTLGVAVMDAINEHNYLNGCRYNWRGNLPLSIIADVIMVKYKPTIIQKDGSDKYIIAIADKYLEEIYSECGHGNLEYSKDSMQAVYLATHCLYYLSSKTDWKNVYECLMKNLLKNLRKEETE